MKKVMVLAPEMLCGRLRDALGHKQTILPCSDPGAAGKLLLSEPDVLILSLALTGTDGLTFLKENASFLPPKVIALTCFFDNALLAELAGLGVSHVIRIPCRLSYLEQKL